MPIAELVMIAYGVDATRIRNLIDDVPAIITGALAFNPATKPSCAYFADSAGQRVAALNLRLVVPEETGAVRLWFQRLAPALVSAFGPGSDLALMSRPTHGFHGLVSDFDGTLVHEESLDLYAQDVGLGDAVAALTEESMRGKREFSQSIMARCRLLAGQSTESFHDLADRLTLRSGAGK